MNDRKLRRRLVEFRFAQIDDATRLAAMNHDLIRDEGHQNSMTVEELATRMEGWLRTLYRAALISEDGADIGYALFQVEAHGAWLRQLFVAPAWRRRGAGRQALNWLSRHAWPEAERLRIEVLAGNASARAFWSTMGFYEYSIVMETPISELAYKLADPPS